MEVEHVGAECEQIIYTLRKELIACGQKHGLNHEKTIKISKQLDKMVTICIERKLKSSIPKINR